MAAWGSVAARRAIKGSERIASPTHEGATTRTGPRAVNVAGPRSVAAASQRSADQSIARTAIGAQRFAFVGDVQKHARMTGPQRHLRVRTEYRKVLGRDLDGRRWGSVGHRYTFVSHAFFEGLRPLTVSKKSVCS